MTFAVAARCSRTGMVGVAITTSSICVAASIKSQRSTPASPNTLKCVQDPTTVWTSSVSPRARRRSAERSTTVTLWPLAERTSAACPPTSPAPAMMTFM